MPILGASAHANKSTLVSFCKIIDRWIGRLGLGLAGFYEELQNEMLRALCFQNSFKLIISFSGNHLINQGDYVQLQVFQKHGSLANYTCIIVYSKWSLPFESDRRGQLFDRSIGQRKFKQQPRSAIFQSYAEGRSSRSHRGSFQDLGCRRCPRGT